MSYKSSSEEVLEADIDVLTAENNQHLIEIDEKVAMDEDFSSSPSHDEAEITQHHEETEAVEKEKQENKVTIPAFGEASASPDQKISLALEFMEQSLAQPGSPHFKEFWEARKQCLELFKENISPPVRTHLWNKYCELSREARRLKEILDEQTAFAVEQIEIAIKALENEIDNQDEALEKAPVVAFDPIPEFLQKDIEHYINIQLKLGLLNAQASRINVLRKELMKTEMRIKHKNKFFQRLSAAGDKVFPLRKELIKENSSAFVEDVNRFIKEYFPQEIQEGDVYHLREEIKALQSIAKQLTLNTHAFTHSRQVLSESWDKLKEVEKEKKKARSRQKAVFKENQSEIAQDIQQAIEQFKNNEISVEEGRKRLEMLSEKTRHTELGREEVRYLKDMLFSLRELLEAKEKVEHQAKLNEEQQRAAQRLEKVQGLRENVQKAIQQVSEKTVEELNQLLQQINSEAEALHLTRNERSQLERYFREFREKIAARKDQAILALAEGDKEDNDFITLKTDLNTLYEHRRAIKENLDQLRKQAGTSGLDFVKAMELNQQMQAEKERFDKAGTAITDLEKKLKNFKSSGTSSSN